MWDSYQVIRTTFPFSPCPELCTMISVHLQLRSTFALYRPMWAPAFWVVFVFPSPPFLAQRAFLNCSIYFIFKKWEDLSLERCQGRFPHFPSSVQWEPWCLSAPHQRDSCYPGLVFHGKEWSSWKALLLYKTKRATWLSVRWGLPRVLENMPE